MHRKDARSANQCDAHRLDHSSKLVLNERSYSTEVTEKPPVKKKPHNVSQQYNMLAFTEGHTWPGAGGTNMKDPQEDASSTDHRPLNVTKPTMGQIERNEIQTMTSPHTYTYKHTPHAVSTCGLSA